MQGRIKLRLALGVLLLFTLSNHASAVNFIWCDTDVQFPGCGHGIASCRDGHPIYSECVPNYNTGSCECRLARLPCEDVYDSDTTLCAKVGQCTGGKCVAPPQGSRCQCATLGLVDDPDKTPFATKPRPGSVDT